SLESDVTLSIATEDAISLVQQEIDPDTLFFQRKLKISGDTDLAHHIKNTMDTLDLNSLPGVLMKLMAFYKENILM
ncbi:MAG TPA: sterol-binding protein, partial [Aeromonadales bacterium]|nr:sterol-binding protein [Aeromonadales bacterium]